MRKNSLTFFLFLLCTAFIRAQAYSDSKFSISMELEAFSGTLIYLLMALITEENIKMDSVETSKHPICWTKNSKSA